MIIELWVFLVAMASIATVVSFSIWRVPLFFIVAGVLWLVVGWSSSEIQMTIVYTGSDYLREFRYPFLITFYSIVGLSHIAISVFQMLELFKMEAEAIA